jgi:hypothetical protein
MEFTNGIPAKIKVATCIPRQYWTQKEKLEWLDKALAENPCHLFLTSQELFGGGSMREICRLKGIQTDDVPVDEAWLSKRIGGLATKHKTCIGVGASVTRAGVTTEDFLYYSSKGKLLGWHSKIALPKQDDITTNGASQITPEADYKRAARPIEIPELGLRVGTVFCWQVFFIDLWNDYSRAHVNLVVHPIKFSPRSWYDKGRNPQGQETRIGFKQDKNGNDVNSDTLGWIKKLRYESEFKQIPIAVTCNTWSAGEKYLALVGWVDEVTCHTNLKNLPSVAETETVMVTEYDPTIFADLAGFGQHMYARFANKEDFRRIAEKTMMRKAQRLEAQARNGRTETKVIKHQLEQPADKSKIPVLKL